VSLADAIKVSFKTGELPSCLKRAIVIYLHKGGDLEDPSNFRPISLLVTKMVEKLGGWMVFCHFKLLPVWF